MTRGGRRGRPGPEWQNALLIAADRRHSGLWAAGTAAAGSRLCRKTRASYPSRAWRRGSVPNRCGAFSGSPARRLHQPGHRAVGRSTLPARLQTSRIWITARQALQAAPARRGVEKRAAKKPIVLARLARATGWRQVRRDQFPFGGAGQWFTRNPGSKWRRPVPAPSRPDRWR